MARFFITSERNLIVQCVEPAVTYTLSRMTLVVCLLARLPLGGWLSGSARAEGPPVAPSCVVYVADGAGNFQCSSKALRQAVAEDSIPLCVETVRWSHGHMRVLADMVDEENARRHGQELANQIAQRRQSCPTDRITMVGHCAGCAVVLFAAECMPPGTVDRIILMAPSTYARYDLRPALRASREGIDSFFSNKDNVCLGFGIKIGACLGGKCNPPAGRVGFDLPADACNDLECYANLRQYPWTPSLSCTGHKGGHFGCYQPLFLRNFILPLMCPQCATAPITP